MYLFWEMVLPDPAWMPAAMRTTEAEAVTHEEFLQTRADIDPEKIGATGMSMGATRSWWLAAIDERVKAIVGVVCFTRYTELMADAYSAYYLTHKRGAAMNRHRVAGFLEVFYQIGDCAYTNNGHHGTPNQRMNAAAPCASSISVPSMAGMPSLRACRTKGVGRSRR